MELVIGRTHLPLSRGEADLALRLRPRGVRVAEPDVVIAQLGRVGWSVYGKKGGLEYAGKVGTGFTQKTAKELRKRLDALETKSSPFAEMPKGLRGAHFVKPTLVAQVAFSEWTPDGKLRHPAFRGLREDKPAKEVVREKAKSVREATR